MKRFPRASPIRDSAALPLARAATLLGRVLTFIVCVGSLASPAAATYLPAERIPTDSAIYRDLERLATSYGRSPRFLSSRPLRRGEARAFLAALAEEEPGAAEDPAYRRAARHLDPAADGATPPLIGRDGHDGERIEVSPYVSLRYEDDPRNRPDVNRDYRAGLLLAGALDSSSVLVLNVYEGTASQGGRGTPNFGTLNSLVENVDVNSWFEEAYLEFPISRLRALAGHTWLRWGPGRTGTLALSDAAPALDLARLELNVLRDARLSWFVAMLDPGPQTYLAGHRLEVRLGRRLSAGLTEMARFDGTSQAPLYFMPLVPYSFWEKRPKSGALPGDTSGVALSKNNVLWSADVSWSARPGLRFWGEFLLDDISFSSDYKPDMIGYQAGFETRRSLTSGSALGGSVEYTRVHNFTYSAWHGHDFGFEGFPIGYVLGPDVQGLNCVIAYERGAKWEIALMGDWTREGQGAIGKPWDPVMGQVDAKAMSGTVSREIRASLSATYEPSRLLRVHAAVGSAEARNRGHIESGPDTQPSILIEGGIRW